MKIEMFGTKLPLIKPGDDLAQLICNNSELRDGDIVVVTSKIVSKSEGRIVKLGEIKPSKGAKELATKTGKPYKIVELISQNSKIVGIIPIVNYP